MDVELLSHFLLVAVLKELYLMMATDISTTGTDPPEPWTTGVSHNLIVNL